MNKDQVKGAFKEAAGKVQETTGKVIGSTEQQLRGTKKKLATALFPKSTVPLPATITARTDVTRASNSRSLESRLSSCRVPPCPVWG